MQAGSFTFTNEPPTRFFMYCLTLAVEVLLNCCGPRIGGFYTTGTGQGQKFGHGSTNSFLATMGNYILSQIAIFSKEVGNLREWLKRERLKSGLTQEQASALIGINQSSYSMIESGLRNPKVSTAKCIAKHLNFEWTRFYEDRKE